MRALMIDRALLERPFLGEYMSAVDVVAERIAELTSKIDSVNGQLIRVHVSDDWKVRQLERELRALESLKHQNETIYMILRGYN